MLSMAGVKIATPKLAVIGRLLPIPYFDPGAHPFRESECASISVLRTNDGEFFASIARDEVAFSSCPTKDSSNIIEHGIPGKMAELIIECLERIDVE